MNSDHRDRARGMLLGAALGDGLGRPIEFARWTEILAIHGADGLLDPDGPLRPTDDTSMTVAVAEALVQSGAEGPEPLMQAVSERFIEWARTVEPDRQVICIRQIKIVILHVAVNALKNKGGYASCAVFYFRFNI